MILQRIVGGYDILRNLVERLNTDDLIFKNIDQSCIEIIYLLSAKQHKFNSEEAKFKFILDNAVLMVHLSEKSSDIPIKINDLGSNTEDASRHDFSRIELKSLILKLIEMVKTSVKD